MTIRTPQVRSSQRIRRFLLGLCLPCCPIALVVISLHAQIESVESAAPRYVWVSHGRLEGHLATDCSPAGAFSPDSSNLAVVVGQKIVLMEPRAADIRKVLQPRLEGIAELDIRSANFISPNRLFIQASGRLQAKKKHLGRITPPLAFLWDTDQDALFGKVSSVGAGKDIGDPIYFPMIGYLGFFVEDHFELWQPATGQGGRINVPDLKRRPRLFEFSRDGKWLLLAQIEMDTSLDPVVVQLSEHRFVDSLRGHKGLVRCVSFSRASRRVVTASDDGKVRLWSAPEWTLLHTLEGHEGRVNWAEFSPDGTWVASAGEDKTVRIWSADDGSLEQTLQESDSPLRTAAFSPNGDFLAASSDKLVLVWKRQRVN